MKIALTASVLTMILLAALAWWSRSDLLDARAGYEQLRQQARSAGIALTNDENKSDTYSSRTNERKSTEELKREVASFFADFSALADEASSAEEMADSEALLPFAERMNQLQPEQLRMLGEMMREALKDDEEFEGNLAQAYALLLLELSKKRPGIAMELLTPMLRLEEPSELMGMAAASALSNWAADSPDATLRWYADNKKAFDPYSRETYETEMVLGAASHSPLEAERFIKELGLAADPDLYLDIVRRMKTDDDKTAMLEIIRQKAREGDDKEEIEKLVGWLAFTNQDTTQAFEHTTRWIEQAKLSNEEMSHVLQALDRTKPGAETGKWMEWLQKRDGPQPEIREQSAIVLKNWIMQDFRQAGKWLLEQPPGEAWNHSAGVYADTIFQKFPTEAVQWLESIPTGENRSRVARSFYDKWPQDTPENRAAAEAFGTREGIR